MNLQQEYEIASAPNALTEQAVRFLINNYVIVMNKKNITDIQGFQTPEQWGNAYLARLGNEPLFRLLWAIVRDTIQKGIGLHEVLIADAALFFDCMANGDVMPYYRLYPYQ